MPLFNKPPNWNVSRAFIDPAWDWSWRGLVAAYPLWEAGNTIYERTRNDTSLTVSGAEYTPYGLLCNALDERATTTAPARLKLTLPITAACYFTSVGTPSNYASIFGVPYDDSGGANSPYSSYEVAISSGGTFWISANSGGTWYTVNSTVAPTVGNSYVLVSVITSTRQELWLNGVSIASDTTSRSDPTYGATTLMRAGAQVGGNVNSIIHAGYVWSRTLTVSEVEQLSVDPFGPVRMRQNWSLKASAAAATSTRKFQRASVMGV